VGRVTRRRLPAPTAATVEPTEIPIARLLAMAFRGLIDDLHRRLGERGVAELRPAWGFVLLAARERPVSVGDVGELLGVTKQAASKLVQGMEAAKLLRRAARAADTDSRRRDVEPTARGLHLLEQAEEVYRELEAEWVELLGARAVAKLRSDLTRIVLERGAGELPPVKPTW
jgi:DNA-binding MarR family transcriptional regulator